jgi:hypothetical protein
MAPLRPALDRLTRTEDEFEAVQAALDLRLAGPLPPDERAAAALARAHSERTYLLRLMAEFEGGLTEVGPRLSPPVLFDGREGLAIKLERLGAARRVPDSLRERVDEEIRDLRNDLAHGLSPASPSATPTPSCGRSSGRWRDALKRMGTHRNVLQRRIERWCALPNLVRREPLLSRSVRARLSAR